MGHGWTVEELTKLAGANLLRVMSEVGYLQIIFFSYFTRFTDKHTFNDQHKKVIYILSVSPVINAL